jgi:hypothetical protein
MTTAKRLAEIEARRLAIRPDNDLSQNLRDLATMQFYDRVIGDVDYLLRIARAAEALFADDPGFGFVWHNIHGYECIGCGAMYMRQDELPNAAHEDYCLIQMLKQVLKAEANHDNS